MIAETIAEPASGDAADSPRIAALMGGNASARVLIIWAIDMLNDAFHDCGLLEAIRGESAVKRGIRVNQVKVLWYAEKRRLGHVRVEPCRSRDHLISFIF